MTSIMEAELHLAEQHSRRTMLRYAALTVISFALNLLLTVGFHELLAIPERFAYLPTIALLILFNFCACRLFVYGKADGTLLQQFLGFVGSIALFRVAEYSVYAAMVELLRIDYRVSILLVSPVFAAAKYLWLKANVFHTRELSNAE